MNANSDVAMFGDVTSASIVIGSLFGYLPALTAFFSLIWILIRIWETETVRRLIKGSEEG